MTVAADHEIDAEKAVLGAMLLAPEAIERAKSCLTPNAFHYRSHGEAFKAITDLHSRGEPVTLVTLTAEMARRDELEKAGGPLAMSGYYDHAITTANLEAHARIIRAAYAKRERVKIGLQMANEGSDSPEATKALLGHLEAVQRGVDGIESAAKKWAAASMSGSELLAADIPPLASWMGDGLLPEGEMAFLHGQSGVGKTFLTVQLMSALSIGHTFNGIATQKCRVGLVELEMPWASIQKRVASLHSGDMDAMAFVCSPPEAMRISEAASRENLAEFIRRHHLNVIIVDPFNRTHDGDENSGPDMGHVLEGFHELRRMTNVSVIALHHIRKSPSGPQQGQHNRSGSLDSGRGHSRLHNDPATVMHLDETKGFVRLSFVKVRHAKEPAPIYLKRNERGFFDVSEDPALARQKRSDALSMMLEKAGSDGITAEMAAEILKVTTRTIQRDLKDLGAQVVSHGKNHKSWVLVREDGFDE